MRRATYCTDSSANIWSNSSLSVFVFLALARLAAFFSFLTSAVFGVSLGNSEPVGVSNVFVWPDFFFFFFDYEDHKGNHPSTAADSYFLGRFGVSFVLFFRISIGSNNKLLSN